MSEERNSRPALSVVAAVPSAKLPRPARVPASAHVAALGCFGTALLSMTARRQISRDMLESIFDRAEEISLDGETGTPATRVIRDLWDRLASDHASE